MDTSGIDGFGDYLDQLGDTVKEAIRPVAQAGAQVLYERVKLHVAGIGKVTGNLDRAIYQAYMKEVSVDGSLAMYRISWNVNKAPHGRLLEWGWLQTHKAYLKDGKWYTNKDAPLPTPIQRPGFAFIRRAESARGEALEAMKRELEKRVESLHYYGA
ncbi:MAG: HK97 gp10 family phage protein [Ottowia sp.]